MSLFFTILSDPQKNFKRHFKIHGRIQCVGNGLVVSKFLAIITSDCIAALKQHYTLQRVPVLFIVEFVKQKNDLSLDSLKNTFASKNLSDREQQQKM